MKRMRAEDRNEIYRPLDSKLKFGYFTQCYKGRNIDHDYINEFYNNPFSINYSYGLVKAENVYQLTKKNLTMRRLNYHKEKHPSIISLMKMFKISWIQKFQILSSRF